MSHPYSEGTLPMGSKNTIPLGTDVVPPYADPHKDYGPKNKVRPEVAVPTAVVDEDSSCAKRRDRFRPPDVEFDEGV